MIKEYKIYNKQIINHLLLTNLFNKIYYNYHNLELNLLCFIFS